MGVWVFLFVRETKARSLEEMDILFERVFAFGNLRDIESANVAKKSFDGPGSAEPKQGEAVEIENRAVRS